VTVDGGVGVPGPTGPIGPTGAGTAGAIGPTGAVDPSLGIVNGTTVQAGANFNLAGTGTANLVVTNNVKIPSGAAAGRLDIDDSTAGTPDSRLKIGNSTPAFGHHLTAYREMVFNAYSNGSNPGVFYFRSDTTKGDPGGASSTPLYITPQGNLISPRFKVTKVIDRVPGPLGGATTGTFTTNGGTLVILAGGSVYTTAGNQSLTVGVGIYDSTCGTFNRSAGYLTVVVNESGSHRALPSNPMVVTGLPAGTYCLAMNWALGPAGVTDSGDYFSAAVEEFPF
jgi:hypothetical protein